jgi:ABC-type nitrate/sulfonate/bicarbonate transport system substrate-binding protein
MSSLEQPAELFNGREELLRSLMIRWLVAILVVATTSFVIGPLSAMGAGPMRIGVPSPSVSYFPAVVAWKKGFFSQEGIQAEFIVMKPSITTAALTNGEIHFSTATGTVVGAALRGFPFKIVTYYSTGSWILSSQNHDQKRRGFAARSSVSTAREPALTL